MTLKIVNNSDPGDADHVGGNDWDQLAGIINGTDSSIDILTTPFRCIIYKSGSNYKCLNLNTRAISTPNTDPRVVFGQARDIMLTSLNGTVGGKTLVKQGLYTFTSSEATNNCMFDMNPTDVTTSAIGFIGEGMSTQLNFTPSSAVTNGITTSGHYNTFEWMLLKPTNTNLTNVFNVRGTGQFGAIRHIRIEGPNKATAGLTGINMAGGFTNYSWELRRLWFVNVEIGIALRTGAPSSNAHTIDDIDCWTSDYALWCETSMNQISKVFLQGNGAAPASGVAAVWLTSLSSNNAVTDCISEHDTTLKTNAATVTVNSGSVNNEIRGTRNTIGPLRVLDLNVGVGAGSGGNRITGYPQTVKTIALGASPAVFTNTYGGIAEVFIGNDNGPVTKIELNHSGTYTDLKLTFGAFFLESDESLKVTYSGTAPTCIASIH